MEKIGLEQSLRWIHQQEGMEVYAWVTDGDSAAASTISGAFKHHGRTAGWYHLLDTNHFFKNL